MRAASATLARLPTLAPPALQALRPQPTPAGAGNTRGRRGDTAR